MNLKKNDLNNSIDSSPSQINETGGNNREWKKLLDISQNVKSIIPQNGEDLVNQSYELKKIFESENPRIINPKNYKTFEDLSKAIKYHWTERLENKKTTIDKRLTRAKALLNHQYFPIDFFNINPNQIDAYIQYRKHIENASPDAIRNDLKVIRTFTNAYGINTENWNIIPPKKPIPKVRIIPLPLTVHKLIHHIYSKDNYENALYQHLMYFSFLLGVRVPSELISMKVEDVFLEECIIIIRETKKYNQERQIIPEKVIVKGKTRKSFKNWINKWRPKVENQYSGDSLFLQPNGRPFTKDYLRQKLSKKGKVVWSYYHPYVSRYWCAIARLIKSKIESGNFSIYEVRDWLGHDELKTTEGYVRYANQYYRKEPYDWIKAVLKSNKNIEKLLREENGLNSKHSDNEGVLIEITPEEDDVSPWVRLVQQKKTG